MEAQVSTVSIPNSAAQLDGTGVKLVRLECRSEALSDVFQTDTRWLHSQDSKN